MEKYKLIEKKVFSYIEKQELLCQGDKVIVGVSGGADSVCLLFVLLEYAKQKDLELTVVHIHHGLRAEADQDAAYVEAVCKEHGLAFSLIKVDVKKEAEEFSCSEEEAGRNLRYRAFAKVAEEMHADKIAVAHNANDRAETFLFHLFRGSDLKGLGSIRPKRDRIIRPLLVLERAEIEEYLAERGIAYCQDSTNAQDTYTRNRIRHHILPYAEENIVQGCVSHIARTAEVLDETEQFLAQQTMEAYARCVKEREDSDAKYFLRIEPFRQLHPLLQKRVLYLVISALAGEAKDLSHVHVEAVLALFDKNGNHRICLPREVTAERTYEYVILQKGVPSDAADAEEKTYEMTCRTGTCEELLGCSATAYLEQLAQADSLEVQQNEYTKCFDYDKIEQSMPVLRTRRPGDYLTLRDGQGQLIHQSLKKYMIAEKIPRHLRDRIPVLAAGDHVLWLVGYRISEYGKISANTKCVLQVHLEENGG